MANPIPIGPLLLGLSLVGAAFGADGGAAAVGVPPVAPPLDYLLTLGPYGALVWGAYMIGRGLKLTVAVELSERDLETLARALRARVPEEGGKEQ